MFSESDPASPDLFSSHLELLQVEFKRYCHAEFQFIMTLPNADAVLSNMQAHIGTSEATKPQFFDPLQYHFAVLCASFSKELFYQFDSPTFDSVSRSIPAACNFAARDAGRRARVASFEFVMESRQPLLDSDYIAWRHDLMERLCMAWTKYASFVLYFLVVRVPVTNR